MKKSVSISPLCFLIISLCVALVSPIFRGFSLLFFFDSSIGYYTQGAALPVISNLFLAIGVVALLVISCLSFKDREVEYGKTSAAQICFSAVASLTALFLTVTDVISAIKGDRSSYLLAALSFLSALYFICAIVDIKPIYKAITGSALLIRLILMLGASYFNQNVTMNAPDKILFGLACVFSMLFIVSELKVFVGTARSVIYVFAASSAAAIGASASIPSIIAYHFNKLPSDNGLYVEYYILFGISVYALTRLIYTVVKTKKVLNVTDAPSSEPENKEERSDCEEQL